MNIGMILDKNFPPDPRVEREAVSLAENGFNVFLFCVSFQNKKGQKQFKYKGITVLKVFKSPVVFKLSAISQTFPFYKNSFINDIKDFIDQFDINVIHIHDMVIADAVHFVNKQYNLPVVLDLHENRPIIMQEYGGFRNPLKRFLVNIPKWKINQDKYINKSDKLILVTGLAKNEVDKSVKKAEDIVVIPNTLNPEVFDESRLDRNILNRFEGKYNLFYFGDTGFRRGTDTMVHGMSEIVKVIPNVNLLIVGSSTDDYKLIELIDSYGLHENVTMEGWQDEKLFYSYAKAADICISPLKRNKHHDTTYANKIFQYMAASKPLLVSDCVAQERLIKEENCGLVFEAGNPKSFAENVIFLYGNNEEAIKMGINGRLSLEKKYNWKIFERNLVSLYDNLII